MDMTAVPAGFEEIRREELARTFRRLLRVRTFLQPLLLLILLYIVVSDPSWIRALAVLGVTLAALVLSVLAVGVGAIGIALRSMSDSMLVRSLEARSETLKVHAERLQDLITLSGEIAHELKNPLASIKGLAQLIEVDPGRAPERLKFLQGEVDRMRGILDEFLNFSRPLSPLSQEAVDLGELCRWVVALHEGVAGARQLVLVAPPERDFQVCCDPRKTKQILVNLVQNAVEASQDGGEVRLALDRRDGVARIRVLDRGSGLSKEVAQRAFQPGVTSKARGSGLGLTIVRTLAEQQGGKVSLANREGGGCVAEVVLPVSGVVDAPRSRPASGSFSPCSRGRRSAMCSRTRPSRATATGGGWTCRIPGCTASISSSPTGRISDRDWVPRWSARSPGNCSRIRPSGGCKPIPRRRMDAPSAATRRPVSGACARSSRQTAPRC